MRHSRQLLCQVWGSLWGRWGPHLPWGPGSRAGLRLGGEQEEGSTEAPGGAGGFCSSHLAVKVHCDPCPTLLQSPSSGWGWRAEVVQFCHGQNRGALTLSLQIFLQSHLQTKAFLTLLR